MKLLSKRESRRPRELQVNEKFWSTVRKVSDRKETQVSGRKCKRTCKQVQDRIVYSGVYSTNYFNNASFSSLTTLILKQSHFLLGLGLTICTFTNFLLVECSN